MASLRGGDRRGTAEAGTAGRTASKLGTTGLKLATSAQMLMGQQSTEAL